MKALPFFSHPDLVTRFAHTAKLNFTYYLKHGRPSYAFLSFLTEELEHKTSTLSPKRSVMCGLNYFVFLCLFVVVVVVFRNKYSIILELLLIDLFGLEDNRNVNHPWSLYRACSRIHCKQTPPMSYQAEECYDCDVCVTKSMHCVV